MPVFPDGRSTIGDQLRLRRPRHHFNPCNHDLLQQDPSELADPNTQLSRPTKSSPIGKKKAAAAFRGLGCSSGAARHVSVPAMIRSSLEWEGKKVKKKKTKNKGVVIAPPPPQPQQRMKKDNVISEQLVGVGEGERSCGLNQGNCMVIQDVWCGPGIGVSPDTVVDSVDCVVTRRNVPSARGKIDVEKRKRERKRERPCLQRRATVDPEAFSFWDADPAAFATLRPEPEMFGSRYYRHLRCAPPDGLTEMLILRNGMMMGGRLDRFSELRLDIDSMSYEQLLELEERIGYVSTGLKEEEMGHCIRKHKLSAPNEVLLHNLKPTSVDKKCSICQEEYEGEEEVGKLECGHGFHIQCIKQWLAHKNNCPVCKTAPLPRS